MNGLDFLRTGSDGMILCRASFTQRGFEDASMLLHALEFTDFTAE